MPSRNIVLYSYAKCSTCREAVKWLHAKKVKFEERPIFETPPGVAELRRMLAFQGGNLRRLFNTSGMEYRALGLAEKFPGMGEAEALVLLASNGRLAKRPFLLGPDCGMVGFDPTAWARAFQ